MALASGLPIRANEAGMRRSLLPIGKGDRLTLRKSAQFPLRYRYIGAVPRQKPPTKMDLPWIKPFNRAKILVSFGVS
jgi:hypothetical protein